MMDAWEILGRMFTNATFRDKIFSAKSATPYTLDLSMRATIPQGDYDNLRSKVLPEVTGPVSLMALGEILVALRSSTFAPNVTDVFNKVAAVGVANIDNRLNKDFYVALGAVVIDGVLRAQVLPDGFAAIGFTFVNPQDKADVAKIAADAAVQAAANKLCTSDWSQGCLLKLLWYAGHLHPVENPLKL